MPHKHRLKGNNASSHELPPTSIARPLPVSTASKPRQQPHKTSKRKNDPSNDTPRAFTRLMNYTSTGHKLPRGLDDGTNPSATRKRKRGSNTEEIKAPTVQNVPDPSTKKPKPEIPKLLPGERMADYSARVDQALPIVGLVSKGKGAGGGAAAGLKERQTKTERKMQRMQKEWREEDMRRKAKLQEAEEEAEEEEDENGNGGRVADPWAVVAANRRREQEEKEKGESRGGLVGLHDVVLAPPKFTKVPTKKLDVADVLKKGGLKRQVELSEARTSVIEGYR
ncbi:MAG: hypothetical protein Q9168_005310, partial [Polycauliona sp. 1 TL-2023]